MFKRTKKKYTFGRLLADIASIPVAVAVCGVVWVAEKVTDAT